ncbi:hypothetical protein V3C99_011131 [Haemonchus contortus]|uniref:EGF-like domain-containing protein n=1 Tax=Haemonchus contortus TaxID=6289 RepID=A0A7I4Y6L8_HAECO|nr:Protein C08G5.7, isoform a [Haemonchus contortus]
MELQHLLVLCCYGGQPFVDFHLTPAHSSTQQIDPTDWQASDIAGSLLDNASIPLIPHLREVLDVGVSLSVCDLFNVTFTTTADQALFDRYKANLACRCPFGFTGYSCEIPAPLPLTLAQAQDHGPPMVIVLAVILLALFIIVFMMVRGCFCDCFGPMVRGRAASIDKPLDPEDVKKCLQKFRAYEARQEMMVSEQQRPLIPTISSSCAAPYDSAVLPSAPPINFSYRPPSPPPSYSSVTGSGVDLSTSAAHSRL